MKKKFKSKLILLFAGLASLFLLGGCSVGESLEEVRENRDLVSQVTYYSNGGTFDGDPDKKEMYYKEGMEVFNVGVDGTFNGTADVERANHDFGGWYYAEMNGDEPVFVDEEKTMPKISDKKVEFPLIIGANEHLYLVAKWFPHVQVQVQVVYFTVQDVAETNTEAAMTVKGKTYASGSVIKNFTYDEGKVMKPGTGDYYAPFRAKDVAEYTFVDYYKDKECTQSLYESWPLEKAEEQTADAVIYAKYIPGTWSIVRDGNDVFKLEKGKASGMLAPENEGKKYWVAYDIDAKDVKNMKPLAAYNWTIWGNNHTISNLKVEGKDIDQETSLFGVIGATAVLKDLNLTGLSLNYTLKANATIRFSFTNIEEGASVSNVELSGSMTCTAGEGVTATEYLYGKVNGVFTSDEDYAQNNSTAFTVNRITE